MQLYSMSACCSMGELGSLSDGTDWMEVGGGTSPQLRADNIIAQIQYSGARAVICNVRRKRNPYEATYNSIHEFFNSRISAPSGLRATPLFTYVGNYSEDVTCFRLEIIQ